MSIEARETLSLGLAQGQSLRTRARVLGRAPSTVSRESARNARGHPYRACTAQHLAATRARQPRRTRTLLDPWLWQYVQTHLAQGCSPEQIAGRLRREYPDEMRKHRSAETIDVALYVLPRGALRRELLTALRQARKRRRPRSRGADRRGQLPNRTPIADRPADVASRTVPGHWEGDLIKGARNDSAIGTLVERTTRLVILARMEGTDAGSARPGFTKNLRHVPASLRKTLTYDRGKEMAEHERLAQRLAIRIFFADPYRPWQRGTNENTNGLLRQSWPKGTDLSGYTQRELNAIAHRLNTRPRKCLNFATPLEVFTQLRHPSPVALGT
ncbi:MAG: IS30 family transposase [Chloroflexota bacterium]|nr:IS30 family transposase [Chloroflexota bacterium]